jgi:hypothetical protein
MADPEHDPLDESLEDSEQTLPVNPTRRRARRAIGCLFVVAILALLIWFGVTHTEAGRVRGFLGMVAGTHDVCTLL